MVVLTCGPWRHTSEGDTIALRYVVLHPKRYPAVRKRTVRAFLDRAAQRSHDPAFEMPGGADQHEYRYVSCGYYLPGNSLFRYTKRRVRCYTAVHWWYGTGRHVCTSYVHADYWPRTKRWRVVASDCGKP